jgi:hypothetical protein
VLTEEHRVTQLIPRGISNEVIDSAPQRYRSFKRGEWQRFFELMRFPKTMPVSKQSGWKGKVTQTGGIVVKRWAFDGSTPPPYARFDSDVHMGPGRKTHYAYRPGYRRMHIDVHPLSVPKIAAGRPIYFCLEGCFKADAVLSQGAASVSSTSVTTWENPDLKLLLPILQAAPRVFIVPDSDFYASNKMDENMFNPAVVWQTRRAAQWLAAKGVNTIIAVPWLGTAEKTGVDDFLGMGHGLDELTEEPVFHNAYLAAVGLTRSERRVLTYLMETQGTWGAYFPSDVANHLDIDRKTVWRTMTKLQTMGVLKVWYGKPYERDDGSCTNGPHYYSSFAMSEKYVTWLEMFPVPFAQHKRTSERARRAQQAGGRREAAEAS